MIRKLRDIRRDPRCLIFRKQAADRRPSSLKIEVKARLRVYAAARKQFELSGQHRDTQIRLGACEVWLKCVELVSGFRQPLERCSLLGPSLAGWQSWGPIF